MSNEDLNGLRIVSAVADQSKVILYKEDGDTLVIKQGDPRLKALLDQIIPINTRGQVAVISLESFSVYADFEKKTNGFIKFFKSAKKALGAVLGAGKETEVELPPQPVEPAQVVNTSIPSTGSTSPYTAPVVAPEPEPLLEEIKNDEISENETVIAVLTNLQGQEVTIPNVEMLKPYIAHAVKHNNTTAVEAFLKRVAAIAPQRRHSVEDLMKFLEQGDLPLAEDGSIIAYKVLRRHPTQKDYYVDCHTRKIPQRVGSYVSVDENLVDLNRRNECSNGLHIARRGYLNGFDGDICVLTKIDPEDVMTVPHGDANKVRVKGYHILNRITDEAWKQLRSNKPMTDDSAMAKLVLNAIKGNHIGRIEIVHVRGQAGANVQVELLNKPKTEKVRVDPSQIEQAKALDGIIEEIENAGPVEPRDINKQINNEVIKSQKDSAQETEEGQTTLPQAAAVDPLSNPDTLDNQEDLEAAAEFYDKVVENGGTNEGMGNSTSETPVPEPIQETKAQRDARKKRERRAEKKKMEQKTRMPSLMEEAASLGGPITSRAVPVKRAKVTEPTSVTKPVSVPLSKPPVKSLGKPLSKAEQARKLFDETNFVELKALKKASKKGWPALGFSETEIELIENTTK